jgi:general secretion pathway protein E
MLRTGTFAISDEMARYDPADPQYATHAVDAMLAEGRTSGASDLHLQPTQDGLELKYRLDGVLLPAGRFPAKLAANIIARLKVQADLLTYHTDRPQEGRIRTGNSELEMRVSTFPTINGERAVVRFFGGANKYQHLVDLGLPEDVLISLRRLLEETSGAIIVSGPAGSGKTTTAYACLREIARETAGARSLVSIEDPIEVAVEGVAQSQVNQQVGLDLQSGLRFLMRQDPEVIFVGEIRDRLTAAGAMQASLTGQLMLTTFHAGSAAETISRLLDMSIEPYILRSGLLGVLNQRLLRRLCQCARETDDLDARLGLKVRKMRQAGGCAECRGTGYNGRFLVVELLVIAHTDLGRAVLSRCDTAELEQLALKAGMESRWSRACQAVEVGLTSPAEVRRVLGFT